MSPLIARAESILAQLAAIREAATKGPLDLFIPPDGACVVRRRYMDAQGRRCTSFPAICQATTEPNQANARAIVARINGWQADEDLVRGMLALKCGEGCEDSVEVTDCYWCRPQRELLLRWCERMEEVLKGVA